MAKKTQRADHNATDVTKHNAHALKIRCDAERLHVGPWLNKAADACAPHKHLDAETRHPTNAAANATMRTYEDQPGCMAYMPRSA
jgi:hypothetical protein